MSCDLCSIEIKKGDGKYSVEVYSDSSGTHECTKNVCQKCKDYIDIWIGTGQGEV